MIYISGQVHCKLQGVCYIVSKRHELWSTNAFKLDHSFYPPSVNSAFHFIARLRLRRSANGIQPHFVKRWSVGRDNNVPLKSWGRPSRKKLGPKTFIFVRFSTTSRLNGEYLLNETWHGQQDNGVVKCKGSPTLSQNFMNFGNQTA